MAKAAIPTSTEMPDESPGGDPKAILGLLTAVHNNRQITQRSLADELGIALGLANAYLKRCVGKGLIKITQAPRNRYKYYLTPQGFSEKSRLTARFLSQSFKFISITRNQCSDLFEHCLIQDWRRVVLWGSGDMAEIAILSAAGYGDIELLGLIHPAEAGGLFHGLPVAADLSHFENPQALLITDYSDPQGAYDAAADVWPQGRILVPPILNVSSRDDRPQGRAVKRRAR